MTTDILDRTAREADFTDTYGPDLLHVVDFFQPEKGHAGRFVILLHGGFWRNRYDRRHLYPLAEALADAGMTVAVPEYRRVGDPGGGWTGTFDDVRRILDVVPLIARPRLDEAAVAQGVTLAGHSAGGHLAVWSQTLEAGRSYLALGPVDRVVSLAGVIDLGAAHAVALSDGAVNELLGDPAAAGIGERLRASDPMSLPVPVAHGVEVVLIHGVEDEEVPVDFSRKYARRDGRIQFAELPQTGHYELIDPLSDAWPTVRAALSS